MSWVSAHRLLQLPFPKILVWKPYRLYVDFRFKRKLRKSLGPYAIPAARVPPPPKELVLETGASNRKQLEQMFRRGYGFADRYHAVGRAVLLNWFEVLERHSFNLRTMGAVLDFGCGTGRLLQHFRHIDGLRRVGTDANPRMTEWCSRHLDGIETHNNRLEPPLDFAEEESFDLVYAFSVFTHIPIHLQEPWLAELRRVLRPGGFLLCTVAGSWLLSMFLKPEDRADLDAKGYLQYSSQDSAASLSTQVGGSGWDIYQSRAEVIRVFGSALTLLDYVPGAQDLLVLQKRG